MLYDSNSVTHSGKARHKTGERPVVARGWGEEDDLQGPWDFQAKKITLHDTLMVGR